MKISLLILPLFLFSTVLLPSQVAVTAATDTTILLPSQVPVNAATDTTVLDIDGKKLETNKDYYILPVIRGSGGGLTLAERNNSCPLYVAQADLEVSNGLPLQFLSVDPKDQFVQLSRDMNFVFSAASICVQSTVWSLVFDEATNRRYVAAGGLAGSPGKDTITNWFAIQRYNNDYRLFYCPTVCNFCRPFCGDVGVFVEDGKRWLGLTDVPFPVMFKKA